MILNYCTLIINYISNEKYTLKDLFKKIQIISYMKRKITSLLGELVSNALLHSV